MSVTVEKINKTFFEEAIDYASYRTLIKDLLEVHKTTGPNQSEAMVAYTKMNDQRMNRWDKTLKMDEELVALLQLSQPMNWLVITEAWCGDAAQSIPVINRIAEQNEGINVRFIFRDDHLDIMDEYLTNGARSIPILIAMDEEFNELGTWGPRPDPAQQLVMDAKQNPEKYEGGYAEAVHKWYAKDKAKTIQEEFKALIKGWNQ
jgi:hypothetical protein